MIRFINWNIFEQRTEAIVNPVNCVWIMGKWLALEFKNKFPKNYLYYRKKCLNLEFFIGDILIYKENNYTILNFPTKIHWKDSSKLEYIDKGLDKLKEIIISNDIKSISMPKIWCWLWWLDWNIVKNLIINKLSDLDNIDIIVLE